MGCGCGAKIQKENAAKQVTKNGTVVKKTVTTNGQAKKPVTRRVIKRPARSQERRLFRLFIR